MNKKSLEKKIEMVVRVFAIGIPAYIILSLLLLNEYSCDAYFDPQKVYDVIKDALLIAAAFLAPVAAFVLFSDWREPYLATIADEVQSHLSALEFDIRKQMYRMSADLIGFEPNKPSLKAQDAELFDKLVIMKNCIKRLERLGFNDSDYVKNMNIVHTEMNNLKQELIYWQHQVGENNQEKFDKIFSDLEKFTKEMDNWNL